MIGQSGVHGGIFLNLRPVTNITECQQVTHLKNSQVRNQVTTISSNNSTCKQFVPFVTSVHSDRVVFSVGEHQRSEDHWPPSKVRNWRTSELARKKQCLFQLSEKSFHSLACSVLSFVRKANDLAPDALLCESVSPAESRRPPSSSSASQRLASSCLISCYWIVLLLEPQRQG